MKASVSCGTSYFGCAAHFVGHNSEWIACWDLPAAALLQDCTLGGNLELVLVATLRSPVRGRRAWF